MPFTIANGRIAKEGAASILRLTSNVGGVLARPTLLVIHDTASQNAKGAIDWLANPAAKASAHLVIDETGNVTQLVPFNRIAWHAGVSEWHGRSGCNSFSIGIELSGPGPLHKLGDGSYADGYGKKVPSDEVILAAHRNEPGVIRPWKRYSQTQLAALGDVARTIVKAYPTITDIAGHDEIAPKRKVDPGPAFDMPGFRTLVFGRK